MGHPLYKVTHSVDIDPDQGSTMSLRSLPPSREAQHPGTTHFTPTRSQRLRARLAYAEKGKPTFPCEGKRPLTPHGFKDASTDPRRLHAWQNRWPLANIGMPTGERSDIWVLDVDLDAEKGIDGPAELRELEKKHGPLPATTTVRTPRGGLHVYFRHAEGVTNSPGRLPLGIDVRGEGGYVLLPPSETHDGAYQLESRGEIAEAPSWLLELVKERVSQGREPARGNGHGTICGETIPEGSRNATLFFEALGLKDAGKCMAEVLAGIEAANAGRCSPPLGNEEVLGIARSAMRYPVRGGTPSPELVEAVGELEEHWWERPWPGIGGKTDRDVYRVLVGLAKRYGRLLEDGSVSVSGSVRSVALAASTTFVTVSGGATKRLAQAGLIRKSDGGRKAAEAATWVLPPPPRQVFNTQQENASRKSMPCVKGSSRLRLWELETPAFRWTGHVKKGRAGVLYLLESRGSMRLEELADLMGWSRPRDLRARYVDPLVGMGLLEERDGLLSLPGDHARRVEEVRRAPYTTVSRRRRESRDGDRVVRWVEETENTASEVEREEKDRKDHEKHREAFRLHLAWESPAADEACRELLNALDREREVDGLVSELERLPVPDPDDRTRSGSWKVGDAHRSA